VEKKPLFSQENLIKFFVYTMWALSIWMGLRIFLTGQEAFKDFMGVAYVQGIYERSAQMRFFEDVYTYVMGVLFLVSIIFIEQFMMTGVSKKNWLKRIALVFSVQLLLVSTANLTILMAQGFTAAAWLNWLLMVIELGLGVALMVFVVRSNLFGELLTRRKFEKVDL
jgi:hypothetical protein